MPNEKKRVRVLIVDDQASIRALLARIISDMGAEVVGEACNGQEAVKQYAALMPHITLLDINMPLLDGIGALKQIRAINANALVVMLTSQNDATVVEECLNLGAQNFLLKENTPETIQQEIKNTWMTFKQSLSGA